MNIGNRIKERRKSLGMSVDELAYEIGKNRTTVYRYESGNIENLPTTVLDPLAKALFTTPEYLIGWEDDPVNYEEWLNESGDIIPEDFHSEINDPQERAKLWFDFKKAELQDYVPDLGMPILTVAEETHIKKYRALDDHGKEMVDMVLNKEYERRDFKDFIAIEPPFLIPYYGKVASAGTGQYVFDDIPPQMIAIDNIDQNVKASFAIGVNGDSMEPTYYDGQTVLVQKLDKINIGEIGIFMIDGEAFVKELGNGVLISHNKKYDDIKMTNDTICIGKVLGKI